MSKSKQVSKRSGNFIDQWLLEKPTTTVNLADNAQLDLTLSFDARLTDNCKHQQAIRIRNGLRSWYNI